MKEIEKDLLLIAYIKQSNQKKFEKNPKLIYNNLVTALAFITKKDLNYEYNDFVKSITEELKKRRKEK